ncbi:quinone oxidoreductase-like protein 2 [Ambystoma mexicanum]|uniref:quinone oxidoreductase-like protein 2 n=1 Tax=Ambystoma mexicanum TaxID=8296 RepID=UPI0037E93123
MAFAIRCRSQKLFLIETMRGMFRWGSNRGDVLGTNVKDVLLCSSTRRAYRAALCTELKKPLVIADVPSRELQPHEVRVGVHCAGVNFADTLVCQGLYQERCDLPFTPGMELSGRVLEVGTGVTAVREGDRVLSASFMGSMAEECIVQQQLLWPLPEGVTYAQAASLPVSYSTAIMALVHRAKTRPGETVLVTAAAGATGLATVDLASNILQAKVIAAAGSDEKCQLALKMGAASALNYTQCSLKEELKRLTDGQGVDVVIDVVGGDIFKEAFSSLKWEGRIVVVGFAGGNIASIPANHLLLKNVSALGVYWGRYSKVDFPVFSWSVSSVIQHCQEQRIRPHVGAVFKLDEVNQALAYVAGRQSMGKVVLSLE